ncbi:dihydrofolate reductase [Prevotella sp. OH937_COT-195]|uniref:dihydrofolate reductase n=1 Tax=Prevotella sp. OH937_COT-195 TaxID=2491051 RepID=UPI000F651508|nr:dihydrofolate reductase [Prevotella sp. OH937_COT-195]RRC97656.1 dihydrofolate reductase [Prevotella sp. OH937_COT-195]
MRISIIAAVARNRAIGKDNKLVYWLPNDLKRFKQLTTGNTIIMGRKTFESLPKGALPNRRNIVLTRSDNKYNGCDTYHSLDDAIQNCNEKEDIYIIGGGSIYEQAMQLADRLCLTEIEDTPEDADTFFPDYREWQETWRENHDKDDRHEYRYAFVNYERRK